MLLPPRPGSSPTSLSARTAETVASDRVRAGAHPVPRTPPDVAELLGQDPVVVAPWLLGATITARDEAGSVSIRVTEVEAYRGEEDPGSHAFRGRTARNASMFDAAGAVYVYSIYGMHRCVNLVCGPEGLSRAILLRAGEVTDGIGIARARRPAATRDRDLARGPARLAQALGLTMDDDGERLGPAGTRLALDLASPLAPPVLLDGPPPETPASRTTAATSAAVTSRVPPTPRGARPAAAAPGVGLGVRRGPRTGVSGPGGDGVVYPWRFWIDGDPTVSPYKPAVPRSRSRGGAIR